MKVLHLISGGDTGGAKTHVLSLVEKLSEDIQIKLVCFIEDQFYEDGKKLGLDIEVYQQKNRFDFSVVSRLKELIEKEGYDLVHCHGARANFIAMFLKSKVKVPFVTTIHSDYKLDFKDNLYKKIIFTGLNEMALRKFDYYIAVSNNFKKMLVERSFDSEKIFTVYNGIDLEKTVDIIEKKEFLSKYGIDATNKKIIGIAARLDTNKSVNTLIEAGKELSNMRDDFLILIAGTGEEKHHLEQLIQQEGLSQKIYLLGFVRENYSFFNALDINVLTSKSESFPYVILEGAKLGKTIISTDVGGIADLVEQGINGYLFEVENKNELAKYLDESLKNDCYKNMGDNLKTKVSELFSLDKMGRDHVKIYHTIKKTRI
jgi:glycosyltransferase involved in cell wall biosynthesis